jgi:hypothetical protein
MLATFTVTNLSDATVAGPGAAPGTLRQAIYDANIASDPDIIDFAPGLAGDLRLSIADDSAIGLSALLITSPITIQGNPAGITIKRDITAPIMRFFRVAPGGDLTVDSINITGGITTGANGGAGENGGAAFAGAIYNQGSLEILSSAIYNNTAIGGSAGAGASSGAAQGGAVFNDGGSVTIRNSTLSGNSVSNGAGTVVARSFGGNLYAKNGTLSVYNSTITSGAAASGRDLYIIGIGAGQTATAQIYSSIIAQADVSTNAFDVNATYDLDGQVVVTGANNIIRSQNAYESIAYSFFDPLLVALANNGGPTLTHALQTGSPAIGHGLNPLNLDNDQRGAAYPRAVGGTADIGAFELQTVATPDLRGDYNGNHVVDAADFVVWRKTIGANVTQYAGADGTGDGQIDGADYEVWRGNFGATSSAAGAEITAQTNLVSIQAPVDVSALQLRDASLLTSLAPQADSFSPRTGELKPKWNMVEQRFAPINQHSRDEALLAITAERFGPRNSETARASSRDRFESDSAQRESTCVLLAADPINQALRQTDSLAAASIGTA